MAIEKICVPLSVAARTPPALRRYELRYDIVTKVWFVGNFVGQLRNGQYFGPRGVQDGASPHT